MVNPIRKITDKIGANWFFLILVLIIYLVLALANQALFKNSIDGAYNIFIEIIPVIFLVFFLVFVFNLFFSADKIVK